MFYKYSRNGVFLWKNMDSFTFGMIVNIKGIT